jgi:hypothetical protein
MSVSSGSALRSNSFLDDETLPPFPCSIVTSFFVDISEGNVGHRNATLETPLHAACKPENFSKDVVKVGNASLLTLVLMIASTQVGKGDTQDTL